MPGLSAKPSRPDVRVRSQVKAVLANDPGKAQGSHGCQLKTEQGQ